MKRSLWGLLLAFVVVVGGFSFPQVSSAGPDNDPCWNVNVATGTYGTAVSGSVGSSGTCPQNGMMGGFPFFGSYNIPNPLGLPNPTGGISGIIAGAVTWFLYIFGFLAILGFLVSGTMYIIGFGDEGMMKRGKSGMIYSILGILVGLSGYIIITTAYRILSANPMY